MAFADLQSLITTHGEEEGLRRFIGTGPDDGWMLPETLRLADYNLGHDDRAQHPQPVASRLGPRFYDWQLSQTPEESWAECRMHAEKIKRVRNNNVAASQDVEMETVTIAGHITGSESTSDLFGDYALSKVPRTRRDRETKQAQKSQRPPSFTGTERYHYYRDIAVGIIDYLDNVTEEELKLIVYLSSRYERVADLLAGHRSYDVADRVFAYAPSEHLSANQWHTLRRHLFEETPTLNLDQSGYVQKGHGYQFPNVIGYEDLFRCLSDAITVVREVEEECDLLINELHKWMMIA